MRAYQSQDWGLPTPVPKTHFLSSPGLFSCWRGWGWTAVSQREQMRTSPDPHAASFKNKSYFLKLIVLFALEILAKELKFLWPQTLTSPGPPVNSVYDSISGHCSW